MDSFPETPRKATRGHQANHDSHGLARGVAPALPIFSTKRFWPVRRRQNLLLAGRDQEAPMDQRNLKQQLETLRCEHRDLDSAIAALFTQPNADELQIARLKKRKLRLRDEIAMIEDQLIPDIIA